MFYFSFVNKAMKVKLSLQQQRTQLDAVYSCCLDTACSQRLFWLSWHGNSILELCHGWPATARNVSFQQIWFSTGQSCVLPLSKTKSCDAVLGGGGGESVLKWVKKEYRMKWYIWISYLNLDLSVFFPRRCLGESLLWGAQQEYLPWLARNTSNYSFHAGRKKWL